MQCVSSFGVGSSAADVMVHVLALEFHSMRVVMSLRPQPVHEILPLSILLFYLVSSSQRPKGAELQHEVSEDSVAADPHREWCVIQTF